MHEVAGPAGGLPKPTPTASTGRLWEMRRRSEFDGAAAQ
jgi:hypothetical protein